MKNKTLKETVISSALIIITILLLNPFNFWMPNVVVMCMLAIILVLSAIFASFILREKSIDEREEQHKSFAGRHAFLAGSGVLMLGIVVQGYNHLIDPWLVIALITMIFVKIFTRIWSDNHL